MLRVLLDVNMLGRGFSTEATRTGIFRASEGLIHGMLARSDVAVSFLADASWVSELLVADYDRQRGGRLGNRFLRVWEPSGATDEEGARLIARILAVESTGGEARRDRAALMLLNRTARRRPLSGSFDVIHSLRTPLSTPRGASVRARALTVHDLVPLLYPQWSYEGAPAQLEEMLTSVAVERDYLLVNSEATAGDLVAARGIPRHRIFVTPLAADRRLFHPVEEPGPLAAVRSRYRIPDGRYLLSLGTLEPRKNLPRLIECFFRVLDRESLTDLSLVLVGPTGWKSEPVFRAIARRPEFRERVIVPGYVEDADLAALYSGACGFVYPSLYEGFGLPVLEAMLCGTPVITSTTSSLPEVAGDAALAVDPTDSDALCGALRMLLLDASLPGELRRRGLARAARFSWEKTAEATVLAYQRMVAASS